MERKRKVKRKHPARLVSKKSLYKTISWRLISLIMSFTLSYYILGSLKTATTFTIVYNILGSILYYLHEMLYKWLRKKGKI